MSEVITIYDLPSKDLNDCWSLNPWKTRLLLNYKDLPYKTEWVEYPDIAPLLKGFHIPPNKEGMQYTIPAVRIPNHDPEHIMDSKAIAIALEEKHPSPPLHLNSSVLPKVEAAVRKITLQMTPIIMPRIPRDILNDKSRGYFEETREKRFGMPLHVLEKEKGGEQAWESATPALKEMASVLNETRGPFFMGEEVSYADMVVAGFFRFTKRAGEDIFERVMKVDPSFPKLYEASGPWLERSKH